eukprot:1151591-Pelagomonas_calceolata.AAC.2
MQAYTRVAPQVAAFAEYRLPLAQHLVRAKLRHWEKSMRELAARGLAALVPAVGESYIIPVALRQLIEWGLDNVSEKRMWELLGGNSVSVDVVNQKVPALVPAVGESYIIPVALGQLVGWGLENVSE